MAGILHPDGHGHLPHLALLRPRLVLAPQFQLGGLEGFRRLDFDHLPTPVGLFDFIHRNPLFDRGADLRADDEAARHVQLPEQFAAEVERHGAEVGQRRRAARHPAMARQLAVEPQRREIRRCDVLLHAGMDVIELDRMRHVGLPRAEPHFADEHIFDRERVLAGHDEVRGRGAGIQRV